MCRAFSPGAYTIGTSNGQVLVSSLAMSLRYVGLPQNLILKFTCGHVGGGEEKGG
jgi:hypothetical protein